MIIDRDRATAAYFGAVLASHHTEPGTPDTVLDHIEETAAAAYLAAHTNAMNGLTHPMTVIAAAEARATAYNAARAAAHETYAAATGRTRSTV